MTGRKLFAAWCLLLSAATGAARADVVLDWNNALLDAVRVDRTAPPRASRAMAVVQVAVYDAVVGVEKGYEPYHVDESAPAGASAEAAAVEAAYRTLVALFPNQAATFEAERTESLAAIPDGPAESAGVAWGRHVAEEILALRQNDHSGDTVAYEAPLGGGWWTNATPPLLPNWPSVTPWAMTSGDQFRADAPPPTTSKEYLAAFREVRRLGRKDSSARTAEQTQIALFWADGPGTATPPGHWMVIAQGISRDRGLSLVENARLFALLGIAVADAAVVSWDHKFHYSNWRPITGIQHADLDGNPDTVADPSWEPLIPTPPFPSYSSGHSTFSSAAARVLALFFGTDEIAFDTTSDGLTGVTRSFARLSEAAEEAGQSRIYGGIHWQFDNRTGLATGRELGEHVFYNALRPEAQAGGICAPGPKTLCVGNGRFKIEARWATADAAGTGNALSLGGDSGRFWFFGEENPELVVKVIDACDAFDRFWVFASGLTNVEVLLTVTDMQEGRTRQYFNPRGKAFAPVQDTDAFATCP